MVFLVMGCGMVRVLMMDDSMVKIESVDILFGLWIVELILERSDVWF